ncbi:MAG: AAA family ATPase, partial [Deltaproteobacteria bacterium]|nr:AAA family ATPase [Deltaproteobacteria bacterium]
YTRIGGFYTLEVRRGGERVGFSINTLDGRSGRLAEAGLESRFRLGKYRIDMEQFESIALSALEDAINKGDMIVIDEIGYMELKSHRFRELVQKAINSPQPLLATIMKSRYDFADAMKSRRDVELITVKVENREGLVDEVVGRVKDLLGLQAKQDIP